MHWVQPCGWINVTSLPSIEGPSASAVPNRNLSPSPPPFPFQQGVSPFPSASPPLPLLPPTLSPLPPFPPTPGTPDVSTAFLACPAKAREAIQLAVKLNKRRGGGGGAGAGMAAPFAEESMRRTGGSGAMHDRLQRLVQLVERGVLTASEGDSLRVKVRCGPVPNHALRCLCVKVRCGPVLPPILPARFWPPAGTYPIMLP